MSGKGGTALVTGGAVRLGAAISRVLADEGLKVAIHCHGSTGEAAALAAALRQAGHEAEVVEADLLDRDAAAALVGRAEAALGPLSVLVNNASIFEHDRLASFDPARLGRQMQIHVEAPLVLARAFAERLPAGQRGLIVNMTDQRTGNPSDAYLSYSIAKAALWTATQVLARELAPRIRVNAIAPGLVMPPPGFSRERFEGLVRATPLGRATDPAEIAAAMRLILNAPSMTGQAIVLDSGQQMGWRWPGHAASEEPSGQG